MHGPDQPLTSRSLRQFAGLWLVFFAVLATARCIEGRVASGLGLACLAILVGLAGLVRPSLVRPVYRGAMWATFPFGWVVARLMLACLFYGVFTPFALVFRALGRDALKRRPGAATETYWEPKPLPATLERYYRPF
jgi:Saxitoxin biosynthesis operon protein SxtJ